MTAAEPRKRPCASCPYRRDVPSGIWHESEYAKLEAYDGETFEQPLAAFNCHQADGRICSGWLAHADAGELLAVRIGVSTGALAPSCFDYATDVPLFESGAAAAEHGRRDIANPSPAARMFMSKITRLRSALGLTVPEFNAGAEQ